MDLNIKPSSYPPKFGTESERGDEYIIVTPRSEISSWPPLETPGLDPSLTNTTPSTYSTSGPKNAWMGAELDTSDPITQLANVHFPEINPMSEAGGEMSHLDFMSLGDTSGDWGREWQSGHSVSVGSDLDGFPPQGVFSMGFGNERFEGMLSG
jgi:hypothetical protein